MITQRQYKILSFFLTRSLFFGLGITKIFHLSKNDGYISGILGTILGFGIISIIYYIKKNNLFFTKSLNKGVLGFISKALLFCLASFCLHDVILSLTTMTSSFLLPLTPALAIAIAVLIAILYGNKNNVPSFAKVAEILLPITLVIFSFKVISSLLISDYSHFLPILYGHKLGVLKASLVYAFLSAAPSLLLINIDHVKLNFLDATLGYLIGSFTIILTLFSVNGVLGPTLANIIRYPEYMALKKLRIYNFMENIENILTFTWLFDLIILGFISAHSIKKIIKISLPNRPKISTFCYLIWTIIIMLIGVYIFNKYYYYALDLYNLESYILGILIFIIIISCLILTYKNKKSLSK